MDLLHTALAFFIVFGLLGLLYLYANRARKSSVGRLGLFSLFPLQSKGKTETKARELEILRRVSLTATHQLHLIATPAGRFLVCTHSQGCTLLSPTSDVSSSRPGEFALGSQFHPSAGEPFLAN